MNVELAVRQSLWTSMHRSLDERHPFAYERVGFLTTRTVASGAGNLSIEATAWAPVADSDYQADDRVGASIGPAAFRKILQLVHFNPGGVLHVHRHDHQGTPAFSRTDARSMRDFIPSFFNANAANPHGALLLSLDGAVGVVRLSPNSKDIPLARVIIRP